MASNYAREVTEKAAHRIRERTRTQRTTRTVTEVEEINKHSITNTDGHENVSGIYRYVDKVQTAQVFNYGKRLLLEFIVPAPAAFFKKARDQQSLPGVSMEKPSEPVIKQQGQDVRKLAPSDITRGNYTQYVAQYLVRDAATPPPEEMWAGLAWEEKPTTDTGIVSAAAGRKLYRADKNIDVPEDYFPSRLIGQITVSDGGDDVNLTVGHAQVSLDTRPGHYWQGNSPTRAFSLGFPFDTTIWWEPPFEGHEGKPVGTLPDNKLPIGLTIENCWGYEISMLLCCKLLPASFANWQLETYQKIIGAYFELKSMYDEQVAAAQTRQDAIGGTNPDENRIVERNELKKHVISMLSHQHFDAPPFDQELIGDEPIQGSTQTYPEIKFDALKAERDFIQWFEQSFEWPQATYVYYPYYWASKRKWMDEVALTDPDPQFEAFLKAGAARVVLPVRPGFEHHDALSGNRTHLERRAGSSS